MFDVCSAQPVLSGHLAIDPKARFDCNFKEGILPFIRPHAHAHIFRGFDLASKHIYNRFECEPFERSVNVSTALRALFNWFMGLPRPFQFEKTWFCYLRLVSPTSPSCGAREIFFPSRGITSPFVSGPLQIGYSFKTIT